MSAACAEARVATSHPGALLIRLGDHFRLESRVEAGKRGLSIAFPAGTCEVAVTGAGRALSLRLRARDPASLALLEDVLARPLCRFAFAEGVEVRWQPAPTGFEPARTEC
jgi:hypothetical protein